MQKIVEKGKTAMKLIETIAAQLINHFHPDHQGLNNPFASLSSPRVRGAGWVLADS
jgi:hypothetical protein